MEKLEDQSEGNIDPQQIDSMQDLNKIMKKKKNKISLLNHYQKQLKK